MGLEVNESVRVRTFRRGLLAFGQDVVMAWARWVAMEIR